MKTLSKKKKKKNKNVPINANKYTSIQMYTHKPHNRKHAYDSMCLVVF